MKIKYLQSMGIPVWQLRSTYCYCLWDSQSRFRGALIAPFKNKDSSAEEQLLTAILKALGFNPQAAAWSEQLSDRTVSLGLHHSARFQTCSLVDMLENPILKAKVWQDLQTFMRGI